MSDSTPAAARPKRPGPAGQYATFFVDGLFFGIDVLQVQEVLRYQEMTRVPLAPAVIEGLINLRGQIVTAVDMRRRLKLPPRADGQTPMNTVVRTEEGAPSACWWTKSAMWWRWTPRPSSRRRITWIRPRAICSRASTSSRTACC